MTYPAPSGLLAWAAEPLPFHDLQPQDFDVLEDDSLRAGVGNVEYRYRPVDLRIEVAPNEWLDVGETDVALTHADAIDHSLDFEVEENYISLTGAWLYDGETVQYDAYWKLAEIRIEGEGRP